MCVEAAPENVGSDDEWSAGVPMEEREFCCDCVDSFCAARFMETEYLGKELLEYIGNG